MEDILLTSTELSTLRVIAECGGSKSPPLSATGWRDYPQLCHLGVVSDINDGIVLTALGRRVLEQTEEIPEGKPAILCWKKLHPPAQERAWPDAVRNPQSVRTP